MLLKCSKADSAQSVERSTVRSPCRLGRRVHEPRVTKSSQRRIVGRKSASGKPDEQPRDLWAGSVMTSWFLPPGTDVKCFPGQKHVIPTHRDPLIVCLAEPMTYIPFTSEGF